MVRVFLIILFLFSFSKDVQAIACYNLDEVEIENIYYVGIMQIIKIEKNPLMSNSKIPLPTENRVTVKPLHSIKGDQITDLIDVFSSGALDGWRSNGNMFVDFIIKRENTTNEEPEYYFKNLCSVRNQMHILGLKITEPLDEAYMIEERACESEGKKMYLIGKTVNCIEPAIYEKELADCKARGGSLRWRYGQPRC